MTSNRGGGLVAAPSGCLVSTRSLSYSDAIGVRFPCDSCLEGPFPPVRFACDFTLRSVGDYGVTAR